MAGPNKEVRKIVRALATRIRNAATKLIDRQQLELLGDAAVKGDRLLLSSLIAELMQNPGVPKVVSELVNEDVREVRKSIRASQLEAELSYLSPNEILDRVHVICEKHADRFWPVGSEQAPHEPRSKWPYIRFFKDVKSYTDLTAALEERDVGISLDEDAREDIRVFQLAIKKGNPAYFAQNRPLSDF